MEYLIFFISSCKFINICEDIKYLFIIWFWSNRLLKYIFYTRILFFVFLISFHWDIIFIFPIYFNNWGAVITESAISTMFLSSGTFLMALTYDQLIPPIIHIAKLYLLNFLYCFFWSLNIEHSIYPNISLSIVLLWKGSYNILQNSGITSYTIDV